MIIRRATAVALGLVGLLSLRAYAQSDSLRWAPPLQVQLISWPLLDMVTVVDSGGGIVMLAAPSVQSQQGRRASTDHIPVAAADLRDWVARVRQGLKQPLDSEPEILHALTPMLLSTVTDGRGISIARDGRHDRYQLIIVDTADQSWRLRGERVDVDSLLGVFSRVADLALTIPPRPKTSAIDSTHRCKTHTPPERTDGRPPTYPERLRNAGIQGRVWLQFVIDTTGHIEKSTLVALLATHAEFAQEALRVLLISKFRPARCDDVPVRVLVQQPVSFLLGR